MDLEHIIQIISIIGFVTGAIIFFINTGSYKKDVEKDIETLKIETKENKAEIKDLLKSFEAFKRETAQNSTRAESLLIEVKTKLELIMQVSGIFKNNKDE